MHSIVIIGAGFSGTATLIQLLRQAGESRLKLVLLERRPQFGRGLAYGTPSELHVLNVPAGQMGVFPDQPGDFFKWLVERGLPFAETSFVPRRYYGEYLAARLQETIEAHPHSPVELKHDSASAITPVDKLWGGKQWKIRLESSVSLVANEVVLACGQDFPTETPDATEVTDTELLLAPWNSDTWAQLPETGQVLLMGSGLTMVDTALRLATVRPDLRMLAVSRHGLLPKTHVRLPASSASSTFLSLIRPGLSPRELLRTLRQILLQEPARDWRELVNWMRGLMPGLWSAFSPLQKAQFLRHLQSQWNVHRHRMAPDVHARLQGLLDRGALTVSAGRIRRLRRVPEGVEAEVELRGEQTRTCLQVATAIDCTGAATRISRTTDPLLTSLIEQGLLSADPFDLGIEVDEDYSLLDTASERVPGLRYIGPLLRARWWEATAVPELREHARRLAERLLGETPRRA